MYDDSTNTLPYQTIKRHKIKSIVKLTKEKTNEITICKRYSGDIIILFNHIWLFYWFISSRLFFCLSSDESKSIKFVM